LKKERRGLKFFRETREKSHDKPRHAPTAFFKNVHRPLSEAPFSPSFFRFLIFFCEIKHIFHSLLRPIPHGKKSKIVGKEEK
jgi:hypothetical protein